jgi:hypothetical protein
MYSAPAFFPPARPEPATRISSSEITPDSPKSRISRCPEPSKNASLFLICLIFFAGKFPKLEAGNRPSDLKFGLYLRRRREASRVTKNLPVTASLKMQHSALGVVHRHHHIDVFAGGAVADFKALLSPCQTSMFKSIAPITARSTSTFPRPLSLLAILTAGEGAVASFRIFCRRGRAWKAEQDSHAAYPRRPTRRLSRSGSPLTSG